MLFYLCLIATPGIASFGAAHILSIVIGIQCEVWGRAGVALKLESEDTCGWSWTMSVRPAFGLHRR